MPWHLENRDGKVCVIKDADGSVAGCHDSRTDAIKHQRALYANESRMASMYAELDEITEEYVEPVVEAVREELRKESELVKVVIGNDHDALTSSMLERLDSMAEKQAQTQHALVAALHAIGTKNPNILVEAPNVSIEAPAAPNVTVEPAAVTVQAPEVTVRPEINVKHPDIDIHMPSSQRTVTFERDPLTGQISKADVVEGAE